MCLHACQLRSVLGHSLVCNSVCVIPFSHVLQKFLSLRGLVHKDISTRNTFIYNDLVVKIGNFGQPHEGNYYLVTERGHYLQDMAPECIWHKRYSVKSDV